MTSLVRRPYPYARLPAGVRLDERRAQYQRYAKAEVAAGRKPVSEEKWTELRDKPNRS